MNMKMQVSGISEGVKTIVHAGKHEVIVDEAAQMGGNNEGPNPLQYLLTALAGCTNAVSHIVAKEMEFDLQEVAIDVSGEFDPRGFMGDPNVRTYFGSATLNVKITTTESADRLDELQKTVASRCPVYGMFAGANIDMNESWTIA